MMHNNGRPLGMRARIRLLIGITILAWATQTLLAQWGFGQGVPVERFVGQEGGLAAGTLELRTEATVIGAEVTLKHVCRWSDRDKDAFAAIENLVLMRLAVESPYRTLSLDEIKSTLHDAGVNLGRLRFVGATVCTVSRRDVQFDEGDALRQWVSAKDAAATQPAPQAQAAPREAQVALGSGMPAGPATPAPAAHAIVPERKTPSPTEPAEPPAFRSLRDVLTASLAAATGLAAEQLSIDFRPQDQRLLNLVEPHFSFHATIKRGRNLGNVAWEVVVGTEGKQQKHDIIANARCWQQQLVVTKPLAYKQVIREDDVIDRRTLVDRLDNSPLLTREQVVGNMAAMELKPGMVMTAKLVEAVPLVRSGQLVTISLQQGGIQLKTVARALEGGTFGQTIRVRNETTRDIFEAVLTGPQEATMGPAGG
jgi:flagella basal body P-ring formation protein FlgA